MFDKQSNAYTFFFALIICVVCAFSLAAVSEGLKTRKDLNVAVDKKKNILKAVDLKDPLPPKATADDVSKVYNDKIEEIVLDAKGNVVEGKKPENITESEQGKYFPLYIYKESGEIVAYAFPIVGKGLWSTLYGYFALEPDAITVRGITYYQHGETPGLGAEIEKDWFQNNFKGKKIWDIKEAALEPVAVVKGKVADVIKTEEDQKYHVDGISGATMTSKGVTEMVDREVRKYEPFFSKIRKDR